MPEILPRHYLIGIILFTLFIVGGVSILAEFRNSDAGFGDSDRFNEFNQTFNKLTEVTESTETIEDNIVNAEVDEGIFGVLNSLISSGWQTFKLLFTSFGFMEDALAGLTTFFGVPAWIVTLIILLVTVVIAFAIYSAIFQREI